MRAIRCETALPMSATDSVDFLQKTNLYLVGMMGAGKTTVGRKLAHRIGYRFLDTDMLIEQSAKRSISEIFASDGEAAFRDLESQVLSQVSAYTSLVVATGGGAIMRPMNWSYLRHGVVIWLDVPNPVLVARLLDDTQRPLLQEGDLRDKLDSLLQDRGKLYAQADIHLDYEGKSVSKTCDRIITALKQNLRPAPKMIADEIIINQPSINTPVN